MIKSGSIPETLTIFCRPEQKVYWRWDDVDEGKIEYGVTPCFVSDSKNKGTLETGERWADASYYDHDTKQRVKAGFEKFEVKNAPFKNLRIVTLEIRDQGGRAYKVCADIGGKNNLYFDLREDVLLDCMFKSGIQKGGIIKGEFIFARVGSQMKVIRVGSLLHEKMIAATEYQKKGKCELVIGGVYKSKKGDTSIYLGQFWTRGLSFDEEPRYIGRNTYYVYHQDSYERGDGYVWKVDSIQKPKKVHVFHSHWSLKYEDRDIWFYSEDQIRHGRETEYKKGDPVAYTLDTRKDHSFKVCEKVIEVPENYAQIVIDRMRQESDYMKVSCAELLNLSAEKGYTDPFFNKYPRA